MFGISFSNDPRTLAILLGCAVFAVFPLIATAMDEPYYVDLFTRIASVRGSFENEIPSIGMLIRAGASNRPMAGMLGVNIKLLFTLVFALGAVLAGLSGVMAGPLLSVEPGMGEDMLILSFVVIVIGGIGSIRGAFVASIIVGMAETLGRSIIPFLLGGVLSNEAAQTAGPALASMLIYVLMAGVLFFRPQGLFPARTG